MEGVIRRYASYAHQFKVIELRTLRPMIHSEGDVRWIYPIMDSVVQGILADDPACTEIGIDFICQNQGFPFGMTLKSRTARALRKATLTMEQCTRIRDRVIQMLLGGYLPQEYRFYVRLLRRTGVGQYKADLDAMVACGPRMEKYLKYVRSLL